MAYQTGTASSTEDFIGALQTFAASQGWTVDIYSTTNDWMAMNNGSVYVQFRWDANGLVGIFQSLGFTNTSTAPGNHTNDSGLGVVDATAPYNATLSTTATNARVAFLPNGAITAYHFLTDNTTKYIYCVIETTPGVFYHWGFGTIDKIGTWDGGEFSFGDQGTTSTFPVNLRGGAWSSAGSVVTTGNQQFTMHIENMPGQPSGSRWAVGLASDNSTPGNDRGGNVRASCVVSAFARGFGITFSRLTADLTNGLLPLIPMEVWYYYTFSSNNYRNYLIGYAPDVYVMNMSAFLPGDEVTIGADTFKIFPARQKGVSHGHMSYAYRLVV